MAVEVERDEFVEDSFRPELASQAGMEAGADTEAVESAKERGGGSVKLRNKASRVNLNLGGGGVMKGLFRSRMVRKETGRVDS